MDLFERNSEYRWECLLCGKIAPDGLTQFNHARKHEREGTVVIRGSGGPNGSCRRYEIREVKCKTAS